jgi:hypothetical protein
LGILGGLIYLGVFLMNKTSIENKQGANAAGVFSGIFVYYIINEIRLWFMQCCGYEAMVGGDQMFLLESEQNLCNVMGSMFIEKIDYEELKAHVIKQTAKLHRGRSYITKIFGEYFFK